MKLSAWVFFTDLLPQKRTLIDKFIKINIFNKTSPHLVFQTLKTAGIDGIELLMPLHVVESDLKIVQKILDENSISVLSIHQPLSVYKQTTIPHITSLFQIAKKLSAKVLVLHLDLAKKQIFDQTYIQQLHTLEREYNITIGFENSQKVLYLFSKPYLWDADKFSHLLSQQGFHMTLDTTHLAQAGGDIISFFKKNKKNIINIHISDYKQHAFSSTIRATSYTHLPVGEGNLPMVTFLQVLKNENYKGLLTMEINAGLPKICESARFIKEIMTEPASLLQK